jgi:DnaJ-class molecular chaperone
VRTRQAIEWHPDKHQDNREAAEEKFQEISEAYQTLVNPVKRAAYDTELNKAQTVEEQKAAAKRFKAQSWNTNVPNVQERLRNAKKEEPGMPPHIIAATLLFVTGNFVMVLSWLGG